jgi:hypothetical protein
MELAAEIAPLCRDGLRRHSTLGYVSPAAFERAYAAREAAATLSLAPLDGILPVDPTDDRGSWAIHEVELRRS